MAEPNGSTIKESKTIKITLGALISILVSAITITFVVTMIYSRFLLISDEIVNLGTRIEQVNDRINRRVDPVEEKVEELLKQKTESKE